MTKTGEQNESGAEIAPTRWPILRPGRNCDGIYPVEASGLLVDVRDYYRSFHQAASAARRFIFIAGWQFDSQVPLLRGDDVEPTSGDVRLLPFLRKLCDRNPDLQVLILAWDFSPVFALEREWFQEWIFSWGGARRIEFRFDSNHVIGGSHHQKFVIIDGLTAFVGGADICSNRWDDRRHLADNPLRVSISSEPYSPYHDVHSWHSGGVCRRLTELFVQRWETAGGKAPQVVVPDAASPRVAAGIPMAAAEVAVSRTYPRTLSSPGEAVQEIRSLYIDAIEAAESYIYIENQYFSSHAVCSALLRRMGERSRPPLEIVIILPKKPEALREEVTLGAVQMKMLQELRKGAGENGHRLGIYYVMAAMAGGAEKDVYIHSKLLIVDDRLLSVGSANTTNRSMGLDTELNVTWEADPANHLLIRSIRRARVSLLGEHTGLASFRWHLKLRRVKGLVQLLDRIASMRGARLRRHSLDTLFDGREWLEAIAPEKPLFDPANPVEEVIFEVIPPERFDFLKDLGTIENWVDAKTRNQAGASLLKTAREWELDRETVRRTILFWVMILTISILIVVLLLVAARLFASPANLLLPSPR